MTPEKDGSARSVVERLEAEGFVAFRNLEFVVQAIEAFGKAQYERGKHDAKRTMEGLRTALQRATDMTDGFDDGFKAGIEKAASLFEETCHCAEQGFGDCSHAESPESRIRALLPPSEGRAEK